MSTSMHPGVVDSAERALPPPGDAHARPATDERSARGRALRHGVAIAGAIAFALVSVAMLDRTMAPNAPGALPTWMSVVAGLAAAVIALLLGRAAYRVGANAHEHDAPAAARAADGAARR